MLQGTKDKNLSLMPIYYSSNRSTGIKIKCEGGYSLAEALSLGVTHLSSLKHCVNSDWNVGIWRSWVSGDGSYPSDF